MSTEQMFAEATIDPAAFLDLWRSDRGAARAQANALGPKAVGLAVGLAALHPPGAVMSTYTSWLRAFECPPVPADLATQGWRWNVEGSALIFEHGPVRCAIRETGERAFITARSFLCGSGSYTNRAPDRKVRPKRARQGELWEG